MIDPAVFRGAHLRGGVVIASIEFTAEPLTDAIGREAVAKTGIVGKCFDLLIHRNLDERELSVTIYHEILEAALVASAYPPPGVIDFTIWTASPLRRLRRSRLASVLDRNQPMLKLCISGPTDSFVCF